MFPIPGDSDLLSAAEEARARGDLRRALVLLDRHHRMARDTARSRLLEASALRDLHGLAAALPVLERAFLLDPSDREVQKATLRTLKAHGRPDRLAEVAKLLVTWADHPGVVIEAIEVLDPDWSATGHAERAHGCIRGWLAWRSPDEGRDLQFTTSAGSARYRVAGRELASAPGIRFGTFCVTWPAAPLVSIADVSTGSALRNSPLFDESAELPAFETLGELPPHLCAVIIPVFGDAESLASCLQSLERDRCQTPRQLILVQDASPDASVRQLCHDYSALARARLISNPVNIGFARSVNRAMRLVGPRDIVLLNSDVVVPPGWLDRLAALGSEDGVGTVTPLSNNGELMSVPRKMAAAPLGSYEDVVFADALAQRVGAGRTDCIDVPHGVGYCLYVSRRAAAAVPLLDDGYGRGYFEDVDFGCRVAQAGLRNIVATNVYVGHKGSASFSSARTYLVARNSRIVTQRWPQLMAQTRVYLAADPLAPLRGPFAFAAACSGTKTSLLVTPRAGENWLWRAVQRTSPSQRLLAATPFGDERWSFRTGPRDPEFIWPDHSHGLSFPALLAALGIARAVVDGLPLPDARVMSCLAAAGIPIDVLLTRAQPDGGARLPAEGDELAPNRILVPAPSAAALARAMLPGVPVEVYGPAPCNVPGIRARERSDAVAWRTIGILATSDVEETQRQCLALLRTTEARRSHFVLYGSSADDSALHATGRIFATGPVAAGDMSGVLALHPCDGLLLLMPEPTFLHPALDLLEEAGLPFLAPLWGAAADLRRRSDLGSFYPPEQPASEALAHHLAACAPGRSSHDPGVAPERALAETVS